MIDFHSHFLPNIDDGSSSVEESIAMLRASYDYGVDVMCATPHFRAQKESPASFLKRRDEAFNRLPKDLDGVPQILLGAEVYYFDGISRSESVKDLRLQGTDYILIEMPFTRWSENVVKDVCSIKNRLHLTPYLAHIERYLKYQKGTNYIETIMESGALIQSNAAFFLEFSTSHKAMKMLKNDEINLLASDTHNMGVRKPDLGPAREKIEKKLGRGVLDRVDNLGREIIKNAL